METEDWHLPELILIFSEGLESRAGQAEDPSRGVPGRGQKGRGTFDDPTMKNKLKS